MTPGTWIVLAANLLIAIVGVLQGVDWINVTGGETAGWIAAVLALVNAVAHAITGAPLVSSK